MCVTNWVLKLLVSNSVKGTYKVCMSLYCPHGKSEYYIDSENITEYLSAVQYGAAHYPIYIILGVSI